MKLSDADIVRHLIVGGHIKRQYWQNTYVTTNQMGSLVQDFIQGKKTVRQNFELAISALAANDWEIISERSKK